MKYEYKIIKMDNQYTHDGILYDMGQEGWEFICFNTYITTKYGYFKRPIKNEEYGSDEHFVADSPSER